MCCPNWPTEQFNLDGSEAHSSRRAASGNGVLTHALKPRSLLDIQLPGLDALASKGRKAADHIFVRGYTEYAVRAFEVEAIDHLCKPFDKERPQISIERAFRRLSTKDLVSRNEAGGKRWSSRLQPAASNRAFRINPKRKCRLLPPILDYSFKSIFESSICRSSSATRLYCRRAQRHPTRGGQSWQQPIPRRNIPKAMCSSARCIPNYTAWRDDN